MLAKTLKHSRQRDAMLNILKNTKSHPSAECLYGELKKEFPNISLATIYRNLNLLLSTGQIVRLDIGSGAEHFDADCSNHYHFVCRQCGAITDILLPLSENLENLAQENNCVEIDSHQLIFYGICENCKKA